MNRRLFLRSIVPCGAVAGASLQHVRSVPVFHSSIVLEDTTKPDDIWKSRRVMSRTYQITGREVSREEFMDAYFSALRDAGLPDLRNG